MWNCRRNKADTSKKRFKPLRKFLLVALGFIFIRTMFLNYNHVPTKSMNPNLHEGDVILVNKVAYNFKLPFAETGLLNFGSPERGDIVTFDYNGVNYVKRIMAVGGDTFKMTDNRFYINGKKLPLNHTRNESVDLNEFKTQEEYTYKAYREENFSGLQYDVIYAEGFKEDYIKNMIVSSKVYVVPEDTYFMIGDNRNMSGDSRYIGAIHMDKITGKVVKIAFNYQQIFTDVKMRFWEDTE
ncbi:signal peptidase I [Shewanella sp. 3_MG-2023]|uniref:signal peptidase I n=1 Tax=Shewanella sp. 3_MG-2023 TaxID=3062635 RepID=UPI0026E29B4D|nr:signal peptidase I [Shewanella sp. 3_MG-2023]MDO6774827.1 signal peptidase I [Shewanella sp. 3_MG-2023]